MSISSLKQIFKAPKTAPKAKKAKLTTYQVHGITIRVDNEESKQKLTEIIEKLQEIETGRGVLKVLEESKTPLLMESLGNTIGYFSSPDLKIALNYEVPAKKLCSTLVHESHHLMQYLNGGKDYDRFSLDLKSQIMNDRAKEADAQTWAIRACQEWKELGDDAPYEEFKRYYPPIEAAFDKAMKANNYVMDNRVLTETFKGWYDQDGVRTVYENNYMLSPAVSDITRLSASTPAERAEAIEKEEDHIIFAYQDRDDLKSMSPETVIAVSSATDYFIDDPAILEEPRFLGVRPFSKELMQYTIERCGRKDDTCAALPVTNQMEKKNYGYNGYLANLTAQKFEENFQGAVRSAAKEAGVPFKKLKSAVAKGPESQAEFVAANAGNDTLEKMMPCLALLAYENNRIAAFNEAMDYAPRTLENGKKSPMPEPLKAGVKKDFDKIKADYLKGEMVCQAAAFILDNAPVKPDLAKALWESKSVPESVKAELETAVFGVFPKTAEVQPVTKEDVAALRRVEKSIAARAKEAAKAEEKSAQNIAFEEMKAVLQGGDEKKFGQMMQAFAAERKPQEKTKMLVRLSLDSDLSKNVAVQKMLVRAGDARFNATPFAMAAMNAKRAR